MAQEAFESLTNEWTALSDIITVADDTTYYIQNRGPDVLIACESSSEPTSDEGTVVLPYFVAKYEKGDDVYLRASSGKCSVNISSKGE